MVELIKLKFGSKPGFVFLDEIQRRDNAGLFLKGIYDRGLPHKLIVSGSGSLELKEKIQESLAGRKRIFRLNTVSFFKWIDYLTNYQYQGKLAQYLSLNPEKTKEYLDQYLNFGGYPRVILAASLEEKSAILNEILTSYLEKDIRYLGVEREEIFRSLLKLIASQTSQLVNHQNLSQTLGTTQVTVKKYLWYAQKTFVIQKVTPLAKRVHREISKAPVYYFTDLGIRNLLLGSLGLVQSPLQLSFLFQNLIFLFLEQIAQEKYYQIKYWRTKSGAEVDFVLEKGEKLLPVEVKYQSLKEKRVSRSLRSFINIYQPKQALVVNLDFKAETKIGSTQVVFLPFWSITYFT